MSMSKMVGRLGAVGMLAVTLAGCTGMNDTEQRTLSGAGGGAAVGAVATVVTGGCVACGAAIGGAVGAAGGYVVDQIDKSHGN